MPGVDLAEGELLRATRRPASTIRASRPSPSRTMRPYARRSSGSNESTVPAAPAARCVSTSARTQLGGRGRERRRSGRARRPATPASASRADAHGVARAERRRAARRPRRPSKSSAVSGDATTTTRSTPASCAARDTQSTIRRPSSGCRCFGVALFMRVPRPPAITTAARSFGHVRMRDGWGARIRTWDHGTKTRCLTAWPRPIRATVNLAAVEEEIDERRGRRRRTTARIAAQSTMHARIDGDHGQELRGREDPQDLADGVGARCRGRRTRDEHGDDREHDHGPLVRRRGRRRRGSPRPRAIQSARRIRRVAEASGRPCSSRARSRACESLSTRQPYHAGAVIQVRPTRFSARCAASRGALGGGRARRRPGRLR